ncbi:uncharacterized protein LOC115666706 [Syzygium oleosum]|uniref:uncharacterized protein LOC115666706 n=1 Tax=Syzygium oleosum TaxID=219896 RepID=UPI0011D249B5|nr:uncharacterized protein LOC115666706 [Syzygium oleosum]
MRALQAIPPRVVNNPSSPSPAPPLSGKYKLIASHCIAYSVPTILGLLMVIFLAIPAMMPPEFGLDPGSSLSSLNISTSHVSAKWNIALSVKNPSKLIAVKYTHMKLLLSFSQLALSRSPLIPTFTQGPGKVTTVRAEALSTIAIVNDLGVKGLVSMLKGGEVTIDVVAKAKRRLHLGPWWVAVLDVYFSCMDVTFTAPTDSESGSDWMILRGTLSCTPDTFTIL